MSESIVYFTTIVLILVFTFSGNQKKETDLLTVNLAMILAIAAMISMLVYKSNTNKIEKDFLKNFVKDEGAIYE